MLATLIGLVVGASFTATAEARVIRQPPGATVALAATDFGAARRQRHARRAAVRSHADSMASQPPGRPSFGYGIGDNSTYGGG